MTNNSPVRDQQQNNAAGALGDLQLSENSTPKEKWLHSKIDRVSAENLLLAPGSFLVRESDSTRRVSGSNSDVYVLSVRNQASICCHFKIISSCGLYIIGSKKFASLEQIVDCYTNTACLLEHQYLLIPVPPKNVVPGKRQVKALYNYTKVPDTDELSLVLGEILNVESLTETGWYWLEATRSKASGWVHSCLVEPHVHFLENLKTKTFFATCTRDQSNCYLKEAQAGCYLVRESSRLKPEDPISLSLSVRTMENIQRFRVEVHPALDSEDSSGTSVTFHMGGRVFDSVDNLIARYEHDEILDGITLTYPPTKWIEHRNAEKQNETAGGTLSSDAIQQTIGMSSGACDLVGDSESVIAEGFLERAKAGPSKKFKERYCVLNAREQLLYCFEYNQRSRPKDIIDMSCSLVYPVDASVSERDHAFQLVTRANSAPGVRPTVTYFAAPNLMERKRWMCSLIKCQGKFPFVSSIDQLLEGKSVEKLMENNDRDCTNLYIEVKEVVDLPSPKTVPGLPALQHLYVLIQLNDIPYARTCSLDLLKSQITFQKFSFKRLPTELKSIKMVLISRQKKNKESDLASGTLDLVRLPRNALHCAKLPLAPLAHTPALWGSATTLTSNPQSSSSSVGSGNAGPITGSVNGAGGGVGSGVAGSVRCEVLLKHLHILPESAYAKLRECVVGSGGAEVLYRVGECVPVGERSFLAATLLKALLPLSHETHFIVALNNIEIQNESCQTSLFRSTSLAAAVMEHYLKLAMHPFVKDCVQPLISHMQRSPDALPCGTGTGGTGTREHNTLLAKQHLQSLANSILTRIESFPTNLRYILQEIKSAIERKWPSSTSPSLPPTSSAAGGAQPPPQPQPAEGGGGDLLKYRVVASFVFLRCISLALCTPRQYSLQLDHVTVNTSVSAVLDMLKLLAKLLQNWANFTPIKEHSAVDVAPLNHYLRQHHERMLFFLEGLSTCPQGPVVQSPQSQSMPPTDANSDIDVAEKFAGFYRICFANYEEIRKHSFQHPCLKKLLLVIDELSHLCHHETPNAPA